MTNLETLGYFIMKYSDWSRINDQNINSKPNLLFQEIERVG